MCTYFKTETDVAQNLIDDFFSNFVCLCTGKISITELISEKTKALYGELNERAEAAARSYSVTTDF